MNKREIAAYTCLMKRSALITLSLLLCCFDLSAQQFKISTLFPDLVSTDKIEYYFTYTQLEGGYYFARRAGKWGDSNNKNPTTIYMMRKSKAGWTEPEVAFFSGRFSDSAPFGALGSLFFTSNRPHEAKKGEGSDIWVVPHKNVVLMNPVPVKGINSSGTEYSPVLTKSGKLYFASTGHGGFGQGDIFSCDYFNLECTNIQNLGEAVNSPTGEWNVFVDPDETYMIFEASGRIPGRDNGDLYISFRKDNVWQKAQFLKEMNSEGSDLAVRLSRDGKWLYFAQSANGEVDIKKISVGVIEQYR